MPDFYAHETNHEGEVVNVPRALLDRECNEGDFVVCRVNAPLVSAAFRFITGGKKATIIGAEIGQGLIKLIDQLKAEDAGDLMEKVDDWYQLEAQKLARMKFGGEEKQMVLADKRDCVLAFCEGCGTVDEVKQAIDRMFSDKDRGGIRLSSVHKAKGLEADNVFVLHPEKMPHPMAKSKAAKEQEENLKYVAMTRAKHKLAWVIE